MNRLPTLAALAAFASLLLVGSQASAVPPAGAAEEPKIAEQSADASQVMAGFKKPEGINVSLFAAEPMLANPVAFAIDERGRVLVCETFRQSKGVEDNRSHGHWLDDDLAAQTVEDRLAYILKHLGEKKANEYTLNDDRLRLVEDTNGDGVADKSTVFAKGFNQIVDGTGAGVLLRKGTAYYTCIPHLWMLKDADNDGVAEERKSLHYGYGVRFAFRGHDMHGLILGPDGRLYFSIGDRGLNVKQGDKHFVNPSNGAVLRCELDGSNLEMFATGLRNPQELAFDDHGNLFTGDNNSDSGDRARWVYVVEGGDTGWRMEYQYLSDRGPFNREKIWHPQHAGQPAYILPPITNFADGPSGLAFDPGTGMTEHFRGRFMLCDFRGGPGNSGVRTFRNKPKGASFELVDDEQTFWNVLATDVDFNTDGTILLSDWVNGWNGENKGRLYTFSAPEAAKSPIVLEVKKLLAEGFAHRDTAELVKLVAHADRRVRQESQFALVEKNEAATLAAIAKANDSLLARLHGIWGLAQLARLKGDASIGEPIVALLSDDAGEVRAQAAKMAGELKLASAAPTLIKLTTDSEPRVRHFAAHSLGKIGAADSIESLLKLADATGAEDPVIRHACVMGLLGAAGTEEKLKAHYANPSPAIRMVVVLALRRMKSGDLAQFVSDTDPLVRVEAARAIYDLPVSTAIPTLAAALSPAVTDDALARRMLGANFRLGSAEAADRIAKFAASSSASESLRLEALGMLAAWANPSPRDRVIGFWNPLETRDAKIAKAAVQANIAGMLAGSDKVRSEAANVAAGLGITEIAPVLIELLSDKNLGGKSRAESLLVLAQLGSDKLTALVEGSLKDSDPYVRSAALRILATSKPAEALPLLEIAAIDGDGVDRQQALVVLGSLKSGEADAVLAKGLETLLAGKFPAYASLDLVDAAAKSSSSKVKDLLKKYEESRPAGDAAAKFIECLEGGDADAGRVIFYEKTQVSCVRCHKVSQTGGEVGPELTKIAADKPRQYLLEAIADPNRVIAKNFESIVILDLDGNVYSGIVKFEDDKRVDLMTGEGKIVSVDKENIDQRKPGKSSMPEDLTKHLTKAELRDLVAYLASLKGESK